MLSACGSNVSKGIKLNLTGLSENDKHELIKFISRISEVSYRRGFQQGSVTKAFQKCDPGELRYNRDIDDAPWGESGMPSGRSAIDILSVEYSSSFSDIGLPVNKLAK